MRTFIVALALSLLSAARPAYAQPPAPGAPQSLLGPSVPIAQEPKEPGLAAAQILLGTVGMTLLTIAIGQSTNGFDSPAATVLAVAAEPAAGSLLVCALGRGISAYQGGCAPALAGGYIGALVLGIPLGLYTLSVNAAGHGDDGETFGTVSFAIGAILGGILGTAIGATIGWNRKKHRRDTAALVAPTGPPPPPPAPFARWLDPGRSTLAAPSGVAISVPLLSLRF